MAWPLTRKRFLQLAVSKRIWYPFERLGVSVQKKLLSVQTAWATRLKKIVIRSKGLGYPFEKIVICLNGSGYPFEKEFVDHSSNWSYLFKDKFSPSFHPKTISSLANCVERSVFLQVMYVTKFVYKRIIYGSLLHCSHLRLHIINRLSTVSTYVLFGT